MTARRAPDIATVVLMCLTSFSFCSYWEYSSHMDNISFILHHHLFFILHVLKVNHCMPPGLSINFSQTLTTVYWPRPLYVLLFQWGKNSAFKYVHCILVHIYHFFFNEMRKSTPELRFNYRCGNAWAPIHKSTPGSREPTASSVLVIESILTCRLGM